MDKIMAVYKKIVNGICFFFQIIAATSLVIMLLVVLIHVIRRYVFSDAPGWTEETARQMMVLFAFISIALGVRNKQHIALSVVAESLFKKILLPLEIFGKLLVFVLGIMMSFFMGPFFILLKHNRLPGTGIPVGYTYIIPTLVGILISLLSLYQIYDHFRHGTDEQQKNLALKEEGK